ncbi:MAG: sugar phosphate nucleotidyltransferase [Bacteroidota bacterium]|nr:sugar phosphate nucleotidyltransferase [Bacteroidota bacterium]
MKPTLLILAAGLGSRYGGLKQLDKLGPYGETIIDYSIFDAIRAGFGKVVFVIRKDIEEDFKEVIISKLSGKIEVDYCLQELEYLPDGFELPLDRVKPWGTGHAILMAAKKINEPFGVINADDFYGADAFKVLADFFATLKTGQENLYSMVGYDVANTLSDFGSVSRGVCLANQDNYLVSVTERTQIERSHNGIAYKDESGDLVFLPPKTVVSMNFWGFTPLIFKQLSERFTGFLKENIQNPKAEFFIPSVVNNLIETKETNVILLHSSARWFGVTYREDRDLVVAKIKELIKEGIYPENLWNN